MVEAVAVAVPEGAVVELVKYLVVRQLAGDTVMLKAVRDYFIDWVSPRDLERKYKVSKYNIRSFIERTYMYGQRTANYVVRRFIGKILRVKPIMVRVDGSRRWECRLCGAVVERRHDHVRYVHWDYVDAVVDRVLAGVVRR